MRAAIITTFRFRRWLKLVLCVGALSACGKTADEPADAGTRLIGGTSSIANPTGGSTAAVALTTAPHTGGSAGSGGTVAGIGDTLIASGGNSNATTGGFGGASSAGGGMTSSGGTNTGGAVHTGGVEITSTTSGGSCQAGVCGPHETGGFAASSTGGTPATGGVASNPKSTSSIAPPSGGWMGVDSATGTLGGTTADLWTGGTSSVGAIRLGCEKTALTGVNLYVIGDAEPTGADCQGAMYVGGDMTSQYGYTVGAKDTLDCNRYELVVGGNLLLGGASNIYGGKAVYAGNTVIVSGASFACGGLMRGLPVDISTLEAQVSNLSSSLAALATNGVATEELSFLTLTGQDPTFNVFKVDASELGNIRVNVPANSTTIVNVSGINAEWDGASVCLNGSCDDNDQATNVLWNFYETTSLYVSAMALEGSVLAPWAALTGTGGHIAGQVIVRTMNAGLEFHRYLFDGCVVPP